MRGIWVRRSKLAVACLVACMAFSWPATIAGAQESDGKKSGFAIGIGKHDPFKFGAEPGETVVLRAQINNNGSKSVEVQALPAAAATNHNLGISVRAEQRALLGSDAGWLTFNRKQFKIPPRGSFPLKVTIKVPDDAHPGKHLMGVRLKQPKQKPQKSEGPTSSIALFAELAIRLTITLPGPTKTELRLTDAVMDVTRGGPSVRYAANNSGDTIIEADVKTTLSADDPQTQPVETSMKGEFAPRTSTEPGIRMSENPAGGSTVKFETVWRFDGQVKRLTKEFVWGEQEAGIVENRGPPKAGAAAIPWWVWLLVAIAVVALASVAGFLYRRRRGLRLLSADVAYSRLAAAIEEATGSHLPISVITVAHAAPSGGGGGEAIKGVREKVRKGDTLCDLGEGWLMVIAKDLGPEAAQGMAAEIRRVQSDARTFGNDVAHVGAATATGPIDAADLVGQATQAGSAHGNGQEHGYT